MASKRFAALLLAAAFLLVGCSRPYSIVLVSNVVGQALSITRLSVVPDGPNLANASPWFWPFRTTPVLAHARAQTLTKYCGDCAWFIEMRAGDCTRRYDIPAPPADAFQRPEWQVFLAYDAAAFQFEPDFRLYRIPAFDGDLADVRRLAQPEGYPIAPTEHGDCG